MESGPQNPEFRINPEKFHPCVVTVVDLEYTLYWPSSTMSSRLFKLRSTFHLVFSAPITNSKFCFLLYSSLLLIKEQFKFPSSWYTVPPPLFLLAISTPCLMHSGILHSTQGFWCRPITIAELFLHSNRTLSCSRSAFSYNQSSRARFSKISVEDETRILWQGVLVTRCLWTILTTVFMAFLIERSFHQETWWSDTILAICSLVPVKSLTFYNLMDFPIQINTIRIGLSIIYFNGTGSRKHF